MRCSLPCYHLVISTYMSCWPVGMHAPQHGWHIMTASSCEFDRMSHHAVTFCMRSTDTSLCYHYMSRKSYVVMLSSCELYMHIIMLARACYHLVSLPLPNEDFGRMDKRWKCGFRRKYFSRSLVLDFGYEPLKTRSKIRISSFVHPSKIFVWEG